MNTPEPSDDAAGHCVGVTGGEVVVASLRAHGVDVVFGIPGTHNLSIFDALRRYHVRVVATTHEQGAGYAADGYARTSRRPGVAVVTGGPAVYNAATALAQAYSDSSPVLLVSPAMPRHLAANAAGSGYLHEAKDQGGAMALIVDRSLRPATHQQIADAVAEAFTVMTHGRPRPVHIEIPLDLLEECGDAFLTLAPAPSVHPIDATNVERAAHLLADAERVLIVAGGGAVGATDSLRKVAELLAAPVATTINGTGVLSGDHRLSLGSRLGTRAVVNALEAADVLLIVGSELGQSDLYLGALSPTGSVIRIDIDERMATVNVNSDLFIAGDSAHALRDLRDALVPLVTDDRSGTPQWVDDLLTQVRVETQRTGAIWLPWVEALAGALDSDAILATDNAMCVYYGVIPQLVVRHPASLHFPTGFGTLGFTVPVAIGSALAAPDRQVVGISGDGGLLFTVTEIATAAAERLPIAFIVFDNSGYGEIRNEMLDRGEQPVAVAAPPRDLVRLAESLGAYAVRISTPEQLPPELTAARTRSGPTVVVVPEPPREEKQ